MKVTQESIDSLNGYHQNARISDTKKIAASLRQNGQYKPIVVNVGTHTGRPNEVLTGNHVLEAAKGLGWSKIAATFVDVDSKAAARIVLADNKTSDASTYDMKVLDALLQELADDDLGMPDLNGSGYDNEDADDVAYAAEQQHAREEQQATGEKADQIFRGNPVVSYTLVFDDEEQRKVWDRWVRWLRSSDETGRTIADLITEHVEADLA